MSVPARAHADGALPAAPAAVAGEPVGDVRVLYVVPGLPQGHNMIFARDTASALRQRGLQIDEFYLRSRTAPLQVLRAVWQLRREVRRLAPDVVHVQYGGVTGLVGALACAGRPLVLSVRGSDLNRVPAVHPLRGWVTRLMTRLAALRARRVVCVSDALAAQLWSDRRAVVIPSGVDTAVFRPVDRALARQSLGWSDDQPVVLFNAGQAAEQKGLALVQQAVARVCDAGLATTLHTVRGGLTRAEMALCMSAADCLVLASQTEGSPNVVKEAMACNLPVVSVDVGDVVQRLAGVSPGAVVARSAQAIADAVADVLRQRRRSNGRAVLQQQGLSVDDTTRALHLLYHDLARRPGRQRP